jgi:sugar/nucleoside kinase (ribokinase family)
MTEPNIVIVGHVCVDDNVTEGSTYTSWGSTALYVAQYLQTTYYLVPRVVSNYGPDLMPYLPAVDMIPARPNQEKTLLYENDTRTLPRIWKAHNIDAAEAPELTPQVVAALEDADILVIATLLPNYTAAYLQSLLAHVKPPCLKVLCPQGYFRRAQPDGLVVPREFKEAPQIVSLFDLAIYSEEDHSRAFEVAKDWASVAPKTNIIVTQGENGASIVSASGVQHIPTIPIPKEKIVDSVGCGDVFDAAVAYAYYKNHDLEAAVRKAHEAAGRKLLATPTRLYSAATS